MAKQELVFHLNKVACQYKSNDRPVLQIEELQIEKANTYFIVGSSGVGKSTILETLGLMNNTIRKEVGGSILFYPDEGDPIDIAALWKKTERELARFRKNFLSFIFQSTNLFSNLTAYQNASISQILKGHNSEESKLKARQLLAKLYPKEFLIEIIKGKKVVEMSGGQRQRLAFARALGTDYTVLLADEPTGNLDHHNAHKLLKILKDRVSKEHRTAIIVSHDIDLSVTYGDRIVLISKRQEQLDENTTYKYGLINDRAVYERTGDGSWINKDTLQDFSPEDMKELLRNAIKDTPN